MREAMSAIVIAVSSNLLLKAGMVAVAGSLRLGWLTATGFLGAFLGLVLGLWGVHTLAL
jgi:protein-S-isoprenylcysteine O-methyltransferase Ste14